jgi:hypothetical protein
LGQVQLAVDEAMTQGGDVREKDAHLAVFHAAGAAAVLGADASRVLALFGKATFVNDEDWERGSSLGLLWQDRGRTERLVDECAQIVADPVLVPDSM